MPKERGTVVNAESMGETRPMALHARFASMHAVRVRAEVNHAQPKMADNDELGERKGQRWSVEEDNMLRHFLEEFGNQRWAQLCGKRNQPSKKGRVSEGGAIESVAKEERAPSRRASKEGGSSKRKREDAAFEEDDQADDPSDYEQQKKATAGKRVFAGRRVTLSPPTTARTRRSGAASPTKRQKLEELATIASATFSGDDGDASAQAGPLKARKSRGAQQSQAQQQAQQQQQVQQQQQQQTQYHAQPAPQPSPSVRGQPATQPFYQPQLMAPAYPITVIASLEERKQMIPGNWSSADQIRDALLSSFDLRNAPERGPGSVIIEYESKMTYPGEWVLYTSQTPLSAMGTSVKMRIRFEQAPAALVTQPTPTTHLPSLNQSGGISPAALHQGGAPFPSSAGTGINMAAVHSPYTL